MSPTARVHHLVWHLARVPIISVLVLNTALWEMGVASFRVGGGAGFGNAFENITNSPALAALYGTGEALDTPGGYAEWHVGMYLVLALCSWAVLLATRLTREQEDQGVYDLVVLGQVSRARALLVSFAVIVEAALGIAATTALVFIANGQGVAGSVLYGVALASVVTASAALGIVTSQIFAPRRLASQVGLGVVALGFVARIAGDGSSAARFLLYIGPFGWIEKTKALSEGNFGWVILALVVTVALVAVALFEQERRDVGRSRWARRERREGIGAGLTSNLGFAWRERRSTIVAWAGAFVLFGFVVGVLTHGMLEFIRGNAVFVQMLDRLGFGMMTTARGYLAAASLDLTFILTFLSITLVTMVATDESAGRLDLVFASGTDRRRWIGASVVVTLVAVAIVAFVGAIAMWAGVVIGGESVGLGSAIASTANAASVTPLVVGLGVAAVAWFRRFSFVALGTFLSVSYLVGILGAALKWPRVLVDLSLYHYQHFVPIENANWVAIGSFVVLGVAFGLYGASVFARRDLGH